MRSGLKRLLVLTVVALATMAQLAAPVNIKLATISPVNSPSVNALIELGTSWNKATAGRARLIVYPNTDESKAIANMGLDGVQAALLSSGGLAEIDAAFSVFGLPFFFESDAELAHVQDKLMPILVQRLEAKKYHFINWGNAGWAQVFSKKPIRSLADLRAAKLATAAGDATKVQWYAANGFNTVALSPSEIGKQMKAGAIDAAPSAPLLALAVGFFRDAPYMLNVSVAPVANGTVMTDAGWNRMTADDRTKLLAAARKAQQQIQTGGVQVDAEAIAVMKKSGLQVTTLDKAALAEFRAMADELAKTLRGKVVPEDVFDAAVRARDAFRKANGGK